MTFSPTLPLYRELLSRAWNALSKNLGLYIGLMILSFAMNSFLTSLSIFGVFLQVLFSGPITSSTLYSVKKLRDTGNLSWSDIFWGFTDLNRFLNLVTGSLFLSLFVGIGIVFFVLPGIYLYVSYLFLYQFIVFRNLNSWEALKQSYHRVNENWWYYFGFVLFLGLINFIGALSLIVGLLVTIPLTFMMSVFVFEAAEQVAGQDVKVSQAEGQSNEVVEEQLSFNDDLKL